MIQAPNLVFLALKDVRLGVRRIQGRDHGVQLGESLRHAVHHRCCTGYGRFDRF